MRCGPIAAKRRPSEERANGPCAGGRGGTGFPTLDTTSIEPERVLTFFAHEEDLPAVREEDRSPEVIHALKDNLPRLACPGGQEYVRLLFRRHPRESPLSVGRERYRKSLPQAHDGRPVRLADADRVVVADGRRLLLEEKSLSVRGEVSRSRPLEPGEVALSRLARREAKNALLAGNAGHERAPIARNVVEPDRPGGLRDQAMSARERDGMESEPSGRKTMPRTRSLRPTATMPARGRSSNRRKECAFFPKDL
jgi:hypothetical protein